MTSATAFTKGSPLTALAFDCGSSSIRAVLGTLRSPRPVGTDTAYVEMHELARLPHRAQLLNGYLTWDSESILAFMHKALDSASQYLGQSVMSVGIDTWGVDYALLDSDSNLVHATRAYRDDRMARHAEAFSKLVDEAEMWKLTGVATAPITTAHQVFSDLAEEPALRERVSIILPLADYFTHKLGGDVAVGRAIASTTELAVPGGTAWSSEMIEALGIPGRWFPPVVQDLGIAGRTPHGTTIVRPGGHDTACAVHASAIPSGESRLFISAGSWSLIGVTLPNPLVTEEVRIAGLTNEVCTDGSTRLLRNLTGLWLLQECQRMWNVSDTGVLLREAAEVPSLGFVIDPDAPEFVTPASMPEAINEWCTRHYGEAPSDKQQTVRLIIESLACAHASYAEEIERLCHGRLAPDTPIHMVGGASRSRMLIEMTASASGRPVIVGTPEASALGNLLAQFEAVGAISSHDRTNIVRASVNHEVISPSEKAPFDTMRKRLARALRAQNSPS